MSGLARQLDSLLKRSGLRKVAPLSLETQVQAIADRLRRTGHAGIGDLARIFMLPLSQLQEFISRRAYGPDIPLFGLRGGDWDDRSQPIEDHPLYVLFRQRFIDELPWERAEGYNLFVKTVSASSSKARKIKSTVRYLHYMDRLYENIRRVGYKPQSLLSSSDDMFGRPPGFRNEVQIFIGRQGTCMVSSGIHRIVMAKLLDLSAVPVRTRIRHTDWQAIRDELCSVSDLADVRQDLRKYLEHPELQDVLRR